MLDKHFIAPFRVYIKWILVMASLLPFNSLGLYKQQNRKSPPVCYDCRGQKQTCLPRVIPNTKQRSSEGQWLTGKA